MFHHQVSLLNGYIFKKKSNSITGLNRPTGFPEVEVPRFQDNRHMKVVRLSALRTGRFYPQETFPVLISVRGWVDPLGHSAARRICQWKIPMTPSRIEPATFWLVAQCLNQLRHRGPHGYILHLVLHNCSKSRQANLMLISTSSTKLLLYT